MSLMQIAVDDTTLARLDAFAKDQSETRENIIIQAINSYLSATDANYEAWFRTKVEAGLADVREGRTISHEEMEIEAKALCQNLSQA